MFGVPEMPTLGLISGSNRDGMPHVDTRARTRAHTYHFTRDKG